MTLAANQRRLVVVRSSGDVAVPIAIATVVAREGDRFRIQCGRRERIASCDSSVDPAVVEEAISSGARVVVEWGSEPAIVGALVTARAVRIERDGDVRLCAKRFRVSAEEAIVQTPSAFLSLKGDEVEIFARRILSRARELARILARAIQLN